MEWFKSVNPVLCRPTPVRVVDPEAIRVSKLCSKIHSRELDFDAAIACFERLAHLVGERVSQAGLPVGLQKIVGFARALAMEPKVLLLDEPSAGLNREEREDLARHILRLRHELGIAMIWVEHDMQMVADLADRLQVLNYGSPIAEGAPEEVLRDPRVVEAYLGARKP